MLLNLITPELGLIFWQIVVFVILLWVLGKFAWKPILNALREREKSIEDALVAAEKARAEVAKISADNERLLQQARAEKEEILKKAQQTARELVEEAKENAKREADRIIAEARLQVEAERKAFVNEMKKEVAKLSLQIAEKLLRKELSDDENQRLLAEKLINEISPN